MISRIRGILFEKQQPLLVVIEVEGIGYEIHIPMNYFCKLPNVGKEVIFFTHFIIREDTCLLFGFNKKQERTLFRELIKINNVGPKLALDILSSMSYQEFFNVIEQEDINKLIKLPGVGRKTAKFLIVEMKDRFKKIHNDLFFSDSNLLFTSSCNSLAYNAEQEAVAALVVLGYKPYEANRMVSKVITKIDDYADSKTLIREALRTAL